MEFNEANYVRSTFPHFRKLEPRWSDCDMLGHLNNVEYYRYFEFVILNFLESTPLDWMSDSVIPLVVESRCFFRRPIPYRAKVEAGLRVSRIGNSSIHFEIALFTNEDDTPSAYGYFTHVYVDRQHERPTPVPNGIVDEIKRRLVVSD